MNFEIQTDNNYYEQDIPEETLDERAIRYAEKPVADRGDLLGCLLVFCLDNQWFGLETKFIDRIAHIDNGVSVPRSRLLLMGLYNNKSKLGPD